MRSRLVLFAVLGLSLPARADDKSWHFDFHIPGAVVAGVAAVGAADLSFLVYDGVRAAEGERVPTWAAIAEVAVAAPQAVGFWVVAGRHDEPTLYACAVLTSGLALHGLISLALPWTERNVTIAPSFASGAPGIAAAGRF